jgi:hypothetical protein
LRQCSGMTPERAYAERSDEPGRGLDLATAS